MRGHSLCQGFFFLSLLFAASFCNANDTTFHVVGTADCADCNHNNFKTSQAFSGLHVTIDCKLKNGGEMKRLGAGELDSEGNFKVSIPQELLEDGKKLKHECFAQLHSAAAIPCPAHNGLEASKIVFKAQPNTFGPTKSLQFSSALCTSKFLWPYFKYPPLPKPHPWFKPFPKVNFPPLKNFGHPWPLPPLYKPKPKPKPLPPHIPIVKPLPPPVPIYKPKPKPPVFKPLPPPVPIYKPKPKPPVFKPLPPPVPIYKPKPPVVKPLPPPVPIYKPKPKPKPHVYKPPKKPCPPVKPKPLPPSVPIYKPPVVKPLPPPVPIYKPPVVKPLPPPVPIYKPPVVKPLPPPIPVYKPPVITKPLPPPFPIFPLPPIKKKPCPPLPKLPPFPKIPKFGDFPPLPPSFSLP